MASSPSSNLLNLPPIRPNLSQTKSNSFTRSTSQSGSPNGGGNSSQVSRSSATATKRARSSSIVSVTEVKETYDDQLDQAALHNMNAEWVNYKGSFPVSSYSARVRTKVQGSDKGYPSFNPTDASLTLQIPCRSVDDSCSVDRIRNRIVGDSTRDNSRCDLDNCEPGLSLRSFSLTLPLLFNSGTDKSELVCGIGHIYPVPLCDGSSV